MSNQTDLARYRNITSLETMKRSHYGPDIVWLGQGNQLVDFLTIHRNFLVSFNLIFFQSYILVEVETADLDPSSVSACSSFSCYLNMFLLAMLLSHWSHKGFSGSVLPNSMNLMNACLESCICNGGPCSLLLS